MTTPPTFKLVYPADDGNTVIVCPQCEKRWSVNAKKYLDTRRSLKVRCDCGRTFRILFETREFDRQQTRLPGRYTKPDTNDLELICVEDVSFTGLKFRTRFSHDIQVDDVLTVDFVIDNPQGSRIVRTVRVKYVHNRLIGAEVSDRQAHDTRLTTYLAQW